MANWGQVGNQLTQGFEIGQKTGGKMSGVGQAIAKVADRLRSQRETGEAMKTQLDLLGQTEKIKAMYNPKGYEPKTQEEALAYEGAKAGLKATPTDWDVQKEARTTVNAMINQNPGLQGQAFDNPALITDLINKEVDRLKGRYNPNAILLKPQAIESGKKSLLKSPYPEYPDAFQEDGIWKVRQKGKKYRIQE